MEFQYRTLLASRMNVLKAINGLTTEQMNTIPKGFNNNIIWNLGHIIVTQQLLVHKISNAEMYVSETEISEFRKGTKPERDYSATEIDDLKERLITIVALSKVDYKNGKLQSYSDYPTSFGVELATPEEAITFNNTHEGLHLGCILAMRKLV